MPSSPGSDAIERTLGQLQISVTPDWELETQSRDRIVCRAPDGDELVVSVVPAPDDFPDLDDVDAIRGYGRRLAETADGGLISADVHPAGGGRVLQVLYKMERFPAYAYVAVLMLPAGAALYRIDVKTEERGTTGIRDAIATATLLRRGEISLPIGPAASPGQGTPLVGWLADPYDPGYRGRIVRSRADEDEFDRIVPHHALSILRQRLPGLRRGLRLGDRR